MALWRRHLTGWQSVHQCCFPSLPMLWSVDLYDAIDLLSNCKHLLDAILQSVRQTRTK